MFAKRSYLSVLPYRALDILSRFVVVEARNDKQQLGSCSVEISRAPGSSQPPRLVALLRKTLSYEFSQALRRAFSPPQALKRRYLHDIPRIPTRGELTRYLAPASII